MARFLALVLAAALAACTPMAYQRPGTTPAEAESDQRDCHALAMREMMGPSFGLGAAPLGFRHHRVFGDRLFGRMREDSQLADFCMRARGYNLQPSPS